MVWDPSRPRDTDYLRDLKSQQSSDMSVLDDWLTSWCYWSDDTSQAGVTKAVIETPASGASLARAFYVPRSEVSYRRNGDMFIVSDESRLAIMNSSESVTIGSNRMVVAYTGGIGSSNFSSLVSSNGELGQRVVISEGTIHPTPDAATKLSYGVTYVTPPEIMLTSSSTDNNSTLSFSVQAFDVQTSSCSVWCTYIGTGATPGNKSMAYWRASGITVDNF
jgi:hypothetical protein